ncbi:MAG: MBL fold metallo-hydrolase, partial [Clostridia bacterium]|nr:MBL fold metallo-hydrolase [Clostridia bacterium]
MNIPIYRTVAGQKFPEGSLAKADLRWRIAATMENEARDYAQDLLDNGFVLQQLRVIDSEYPYDKNLFYWFYKGEISVFVFYDASKHTTFITAEPKGDLPSNEKVAAGAYTPSVTQLSVAGMGYVIRLADGAFICVDGGHAKNDADEKLYEFLRANTADEKPKIALWVFTHAHEDHIEAAAAFLKKYREKVEVAAFAYQFADLEKATPSMNDFDIVEIRKWEESLRLYPNAKKYAL